MTIRQGHIYWVPAEALRPSVPGVPHPHVVVQSDLLNDSRIPTTVVCALSTDPRRAHEPGNVLLDPDEGGLPKQSVVVVSRISTVDKAALGEPIGRLSEARVDQILSGLAFAQRFHRT